MLPQRPDPERIQKAIEATTARKEALSMMIESLVNLKRAFDDRHRIDSDMLWVTAYNVADSYLRLQKLDLAGVEAMLADLERAKQQASSPIIPAMMSPRGRG